MADRKPHNEYAIVDIETTGSHASGNRITEIAIIIHDGNQIVQKYETLVNPNQKIPPFIVALTGITDEMVERAPEFSEVAQEIFDLLDGRIFVAHNVNFDYSFVRHQLETCGFKWTAKKLCTIRLGRRLHPGLRSYNLGNLCRALDITNENPHRAGSDAYATALAFSKLLQRDSSGVIIDMLKRDAGEQQLPPHLDKKELENLPSGPGIYYFRDRVGKIVYVGKAVNIKKRVASHFTGHNPNPQRQHFLENIFSVSYESCATELMAYLLECIEIKKHWPQFNRALKRFEPKYGLVVYEDRQGYKRLAVGRLGKFQKCVQVYNKEYEGIRTLQQLVLNFDLDTRLVSFSQTSEVDPAFRFDSSPLPSPESHNRMVEEALGSLEQTRKSFAIFDKGREAGEQSCIWVEKGHFHAMGYVAADTQIYAPEDLRDNLTRYRGNHYMMQLIDAYVQRYPAKVREFV